MLLEHEAEGELMRDFLASLGSLLILTGGLFLCCFYALYDTLREAAGAPAPVRAVTNAPPRLPALAEPQILPEAA